MIWGIVAIAALLAFAHVGLRASRQQDARDSWDPAESPEPKPFPRWCKVKGNLHVRMGNGEEFRSDDEFGINWWYFKKGIRVKGFGEQDAELCALAKKIEWEEPGAMAGKCESLEELRNP